MKDLLLGLLIGGILGLWIGVNLGKDQSLISNPFANQGDMSKKMDQLQNDVSKKSKEIYNDTKKAVDDALNQ
jgi:hypothetical protein